MNRVARDLFELLSECVIRVDLGESHGSAFWVAPGMLLTCSHVVGELGVDDRFVVITWKGATLSARILASEQQFDLALLEVPPDSVPKDHPCVLFSDTVSVGDTLYTFGFSEEYIDGEPATPEVEGFSENPRMIKLKGAQIFPGLSGAPLLNLRTGAVCGMVRRTRDRSSDLGGRAIPTDVILERFQNLSKLQVQYHETTGNWITLLTREQLTLLRLARQKHSFAWRVAQLYKLLHYAVTLAPTFAGRTTDLYIRRRLGDYTIERLIKCNDEMLTQEELDGFAACVRCAKKEHPMLQAAIVSVPGVDPRIAAQAANDAIGITLFHDLEAQLFDGHAYAAQLKKDCEENEQYSLALYIEPEIAEELRGQGAKSADFLDQWLRASLQISFLHVPGGVT